MERGGNPARNWTAPQRRPIRMDDPNPRNIPRGYLNNNIVYPLPPNMQGIPSTQAPLNPHGCVGCHNHHPPYNPYINHYQPDVGIGNISPIPRSPAPEKITPPPGEDPEKIRLEAEIAVFNDIEEKARLAEMERDKEAQIMKEAEEDFHRRMEDMRRTEDKADQKMKRAEAEAEERARMRFEAEMKAAEDRRRAEAEMMASAENAALERFRNEKQLEEKRSSEFRKYTVNLEKEIRLRVEMEKRAELAEREAKIRQSEDLERLAKVKMLQSMDELVSLAKERVISSIFTDRDTITPKERPNRLISPQNETQDEITLSRNENRRNEWASIVKESTMPQCASASTVRLASDTSLKSPELSPDRCWGSVHPEVPNAPDFREPKIDDGLIPSGNSTNKYRPLSSDRRGRSYAQVNEFENQWEEARVTNDQGMIDRIADAVVKRLMTSPYNHIPIHHHGYTNRWHNTNPFIPANEHYQRYMQSSINQTPGYFAQGPTPCGPTRRFFRPLKPDHLRGKNIKGSGKSPSLDTPTHATPSKQQHNPFRQSGSGTTQSSLETWLNDTQGPSDKTRSQKSYAEVEAVTKEPSSFCIGKLIAESTGRFSL
ncbi:hypothetical protein SNK04_004528 [Fusarium graminearum]